MRKFLISDKVLYDREKMQINNYQSSELPLIGAGFSLVYCYNVALVQTSVKLDVTASFM